MGEKKDMVPAKKLENFMKFLQRKKFDREEFARIVSQHKIETEVAMATFTRGVFTVGAALVVAKEKIPHGGWLNFLESAGVSDRTARRYMLWARRAEDKGVLENMDKLDALPYGKAQEVLALPEPELKRLLNGNKVGDLTMGRIERMTVVELKDELLKTLGKQAQLKDKVARGRQQLNSKEAEIAAMRAEHTRRQLSEGQARLLRALEEVGPVLGEVEEMSKKEAGDCVLNATLLMNQAINLHNKLHSKLGLKGHQPDPEKVQALNEEFGHLDAELTEEGN